jgi:hypothetical protein
MVKSATGFIQNITYVFEYLFQLRLFTFLHQETG